MADVTALAVPVPLNNELYAIAVAGPSHRVDEHFVAISGALLQVQAEILEAEVTHHG